MSSGVVGWKKARGGTSPWRYWRMDWVMSIGLNYLVQVCVTIVTNGYRLNYMAQNRFQWHRFIHSLSSPRLWASEFLMIFLIILIWVYLWYLIFSINTYTVTTFTTLEFSPTISFLCVNGVWKIGPMYMHTRFSVAFDWLTHLIELIE